jgi:hypothetical protein
MSVEFISGMRLLLAFYLFVALVTLFALVRAVMLLASARSRAHFARRPFGTLLLLALLGIVWLTPWGTALGYIKARLDARHRLVLSNPPSAEVRDPKIFSRILNDRYGIFCPPAKVHPLTIEEINFHRSYNTVMRAAITRHYGRDIIAECEQAARDETACPPLTPPHSASPNTR